MKETICPTCGAKCKETEGTLSTYYPELKGTLVHLTPLPQPDLTKLRKYYNLIMNDDIDVAIMDYSGSEKIQELRHAVKEVLDVKNDRGNINTV